MDKIKDTNLEQLFHNSEFKESIKRFFKGLIISDYSDLSDIFARHFILSNNSGDISYHLHLDFKILKRNKRNVKAREAKIREYSKAITCGKYSVNCIYEFEKDSEDNYNVDFRLIIM